MMTLQVCLQLLKFFQRCKNEQNADIQEANCSALYNLADNNENNRVKTPHAPTENKLKKAIYHPPSMPTLTSA